MHHCFREGSIFIQPGNPSNPSILILIFIWKLSTPPHPPHITNPQSHPPPMLMLLTLNSYMSLTPNSVLISPSGELVLVCRILATPVISILCCSALHTPNHLLPIYKAENINLLAILLGFVQCVPYKIT